MPYGKKISIIGAGGWGTALAILLAENKHNVTLYEYFEDYTQFLNKTRENLKFLPGVQIPKSIEITNSLHLALHNIDILILAVPSKYLRNILRRISKIKISKKVIVLSVIKGIDYKTLDRISVVISKELNLNGRIAVLSGPSHAEEVSRKVPTVVVIASKNKEMANMLQKVFSNNYFRVYTSYDVIGVELGGALKNVISLAKGILDGIGTGDNTKAALITRGLIEIKRLASQMGARPDTLNGLSGIGDLIVTCMSKYSRNRMVGERIGKGEKLKDILISMEMVAEGITTTKTCYKISKTYNLEMPITKEVYNVLFKDKSPIKAISNLMQRKLKSE
ncbi:MAG: NAD(P)H-dependent glycerol-3-phosphate dehydrogenase [Candidatus Firestonebacteria bacterium]